MADIDLLLTSDLSSFFETELSEAGQRVGVVLEEPTRGYLAKLLLELPARGVTPGTDEYTLARLYERALGAGADARLTCYQELGDVALYTAGVFVDYAESSAGRDYFVDLGGRGYRTASDLSRQGADGGSLAGLCARLADDFPELVDVLNCFAERARGAHGETVGRLIERWAATGDSGLGRRLVGAGALTTSTLPKRFDA